MSIQNKFIGAILDRIESNKDLVANQWLNPQGTITRHFYLDNLLPSELCQEIYNAFPRDGDGFFNRDSFREKKRTSADLSAYEPILSAITYAFQDEKVVQLISKIVRFTEIEPDPNLYAGGLSMMFRGDFLNPHLDNSHDGERMRYRRLNLLYYVTPNWKVENGGNLELWDEKKLTPKTITAETNRLIVMETNKSSWHSVSAVQHNEPRCCVSNYYFSKISPDNEDYFHVTSFIGRPEEKFRRLVGVVDNHLRNFLSKTLRTGRGKNLTNKSKK